MKKSNIELVKAILINDQTVSDLQREQVLAICQGKKPPIVSEWFKRKEAAQYLSVSEETIKNYREKGIIKAYRKGEVLRYKRSDLDNLGN